MTDMFLAPRYSSVLRRTARHTGRSGFTLLEMIIATMIIASSLVILMVGVTRAKLDYARARGSFDAYWMANVLMNGLVSEQLPEFAGQNAAISGEGTFLRFLEEMKAPMSDYSERQLIEFEKWRYTYSKELVVINTRGTYEPEETGERPYFGDEETWAETVPDADGRPIPNDEPAPEELRKLPAARLIRIKLELAIPSEAGKAYDFNEEDFRSSEVGDPGKISLITFIDPDDFKPDSHNADPAAPGNNQNQNNQQK